MGATGRRGGASAPRSAGCAGCGAEAPAASAGSTWLRNACHRVGCCRARRSRRGALAPRCASHRPCSGMGRCRRRMSSVFDLAQLRPHPLRDRDAPEHEPSAPGLPADVREAEEVERLRLPEAPRLPVLGGEPPELDQPRLLGMQLQAELREPLAQVGEEPLGVGTDARSPTTKSSAKRTMITSPRACRASTAGPTGRRRSAGRRSRAAAKPMPPAALPPRSPSTPRPR